MMFTLVCLFNAATTKDGDWIVGGLICLVAEVSIYRWVFSA